MIAGRPARLVRTDTRGPARPVTVALIASILVGLMNLPSSAQTTKNVQGEVKALRGSRVVIDLGSAKGLKAGVEGTVWYELTLPNNVKRRITVARIRIAVVQSDSAEAVIVASTERLRVGYQVSLPIVAEALQRPCTGHVFVKTDPAGAIVSINDTSISDRTPTLVERLECGTYRVSVSLTHHEDAQRDVTIRDGDIEQLTISLTKRKARVRISVTPAGADISFDGRWRGSAPLVLDNVEWGEHTLRAEKQGFSASERVVVIENTSQTDYHILLSPLASSQPSSAACVGHLFVRTDPAGATVRVNGTVMSERAPTLIERLACGAYRVDLSLARHNEVRREVVIRGGQIEQLTVGLEKRRSRIRITASPEGADVVFDGLRRGTTPLVIEGVEWGDHTIRLEKSGFEPIERRIILEGPGAAEYSLALTRAVKNASVALSALGYEAYGGTEAGITLGLFKSEYAVELGNDLAISWRITSTESTRSVLPGSHRFRILVRRVIAGLGPRDPEVVYEKIVSFAEGSDSSIKINFLTRTIRVNDEMDYLTRGPFEWR